MALEHRFACMLPNGVHARPASHLVAAATHFPSDIILINERTGTAANAKSVLALISADMQAGDPLLLRVSGPLEESAFEEISRFLRDDFAGFDEVLPSKPSKKETLLLPRSLRAASPETILRGTPQSGGIAEGTIARVEGLRLSEALRQNLAAQKAISPAEEQARFKSAVSALEISIAAEITRASGLEKDVLRAHALLLRDASLAESVWQGVSKGAMPLGEAIVAAIEQFSATLRDSTSAYLQERVLDLQDVGGRLLREIYGSEAMTPVPALDQPSIVVAEGLTPGQFLALSRDHLRGLVLQNAGSTSHTIILARSLGLPVIVNVDGIAAWADGTMAILDANLGVLLPEPNEETQAHYARENRQLQRVAERARAFIARPAASRDGRRLPVLANVSSAAEVARAVEQGAEGVGLFRTEMLFIGREVPPSEEEQTEVYSAAARAADGRPVTLRTFDIGGDKPASYLNLPVEKNPFLGYRGVRIYGEFADLLRAQLRAIFRAAAHGPVRIMAPMVACPAEMRNFRSIVEEVHAQLGAPEVPTGMMIEVPSAAFSIPEFASISGFFSLGTNDLLQYFFAADRENAKVASLPSPLHPAFARMLRLIVEQAHHHGKQVGLCGELAENSMALPILLGLELDSISLATSRVLATKADLATLDSHACREGVNELLSGTDESADSCLKRFQAGAAPAPLLAIDLIEPDSSSATKHQAIKELTDLLSVSGRLKDAAGVEEAIWAREETYSTGFGHGFAVPHCQSEHVSAGSIALVRTRHGVEWGASDGKPVRVAILIALRAEDKGREHLRFFAKLSRLLMNEDFRARVEEAEDARAILLILSKELEIQGAA